MAAGVGSLGNLVNAKVAGVPVWLAAAAGLGGYLLIRKLGLFGASSSSAAAPANTPNQGIPAGFVPASEVGLPQPAAAPTPSSPNLGVGSQAQIGMGDGQPVLLVRPSLDGSGAWTSDGYAPDGSVVTITGPAVSATWGTQSFQAVPITYIGRPTWTNAIGVKPTSGVGGRGGRAGGSRSAVLMHAAHPLVKQRVRFPHYHVVGRGGAGTIHQVARASGLHPGRLMALNSHLRESGYRLKPGDVVRIA